MIDNTVAANVTGHPALSINAGWVDKLPIGMMIVGRHWDETTVQKVARAHEKPDFMQYCRLCKPGQGYQNH